MRNLLVILRTCTSVNMVNDRGSGRYIKVSKRDLVKKCVSSLVNSINNVQGHVVKLIVLDDHSDSSSVQDISTIISNCKFPAQLISVTCGTGNGFTMSEVYKLVEDCATDLWYHVEDDYLHTESAVQDMLDTVSQFEDQTDLMVAINPHDDVWRYHEPYSCYILHGPHRHYRTVQHTTYTCLASKELYSKYKNHFLDLVRMTTDREDWVENKSINLVWQKSDVSLFSPIPSLAFHIMDESGRDPYANINDLWDSIPNLWKESSSRPNIAIASMFNESHKDLANYTWYKNKVPYAGKHGYTAIAKTDNFNQSQLHFDKFTHILDIMNTRQDIDWIWWLDNDAIITNFDIKLETLVDSDYHIIMSTDIASLNNGSFFVRNSIQGREWVEFILSKKAEYKDNTKWPDQQPVIDFYPKFQHLFKILPQNAINSYDYSIYNVEGVDLLGNEGQWRVGDLVLHWPALSNDLRLQLFKHYEQFIQDTK